MIYHIPAQIFSVAIWSRCRTDYYTIQITITDYSN